MRNVAPRLEAQTPEVGPEEGRNTDRPNSPEQTSLPPSTAKSGGPQDTFKSPISSDSESLKDLRLKTYLRREGSYRYEKAELDELMKAALPPPYPWPDRDQMEALATEYIRITGSPLVRGGWSYFRACVATHGPDTIPLLEELWRLAPTTTNLIADLRTNQPRVGAVEPLRPTIVPAPQAPSDDGWNDDPIGRNASATWGPLEVDEAKYQRDLERIRQRELASPGVACDNYDRHRFDHRRQGDRFVCDACSSSP